MSSLRLLLALFLFACPMQAMQLVQQGQGRVDDVGERAERGERGEEDADPAGEDSGEFVHASVRLRPTPPPQASRLARSSRRLQQIQLTRNNAPRRASKRQRLHRLQRRVLYGDDDGEDPDPIA